MLGISTRLYNNIKFKQLESTVTLYYALSIDSDFALCHTVTRVEPLVHLSDCDKFVEFQFNFLTHLHNRSLLFNRDDVKITNVLSECVVFNK
jgi:hypothetical protein